MKILFLMLCTMTASAQLNLNNPAFLGSCLRQSSGFFPTNLPGGISAYGWWEPSRAYVTNGTVGTLPNLTSIGSAFNFTNGSAVPVPPIRQVAALNGLDTLWFMNSQNNFMLCQSYTSAQPHEVFMVFAITNVASSVFPLSGFVTGGSSYHRFLHNSASNKKFSIGSGGAGDAVVSQDITNAYFVLDLVFSNANTTIYTNGTKALTVSAGTSVAAGLCLGANDGSAKPAMSFAGMCTFTNILDTTGRSNTTFYWRNRFGI